MVLIANNKLCHIEFENGNSLLARLHVVNSVPIELSLPWKDEGIRIEK